MFPSINTLPLVPVLLLMSVIEPVKSSAPLNTMPPPVPLVAALFEIVTLPVPAQVVGAIRTAPVLTFLSLLFVMSRSSPSVSVPPMIASSAPPLVLSMKIEAAPARAPF